VPGVLRDVRQSVRVLLRNPLLANVAVLSLALGIGGAASVFTVLNAIVLRDLPVQNPQQLFTAEKHLANEVITRYSWPLIQQAQQELRGRAELLAATSATQMQVRSPQPIDGGAMDRSNVQLVSGSFFEVLRQRPQLGRLIEPRDTAAVGASPVMVISDAYWHRRFGRDPAIVGRELIIGGATLTVIGVASPGFFGPFLAFRNPDVWVPLTMQADIRYAFNASTSEGTDNTKPWPPQPGMEWLSLFARVPDRANADGVASALTLLHQRDASARLGAASVEDRARLERERIVLSNAGRGVSFLRGDLSSRLFVLLAMVGVLLAITCGNVASLLVARASAREREIAVRTALGAGRWRIVRQLLGETMILSLVGGALGLLVAAWGCDLLLSMFTGGAATIDLDTSFDWRVLLFAVSLTMICGLAAGILPALRSTRVSPTDAIKAQARQVGHAGGRRGALVGKTLVTAQMAFCLLLLVVAGLFVRSMQALTRTDVGFDRDRLLVARMDVRSMGYSSERRQALYDRVLDRLARTPGVESASASLNGPLGTSWRASSLVVEGYSPAADEQLVTNEEFVTLDYFETVGLRLIDGRGFTPDDGRQGTQATIVNQSMAKRFFPNGGAVGKRWASEGDAVQPDSPVIVGVVQDAKYVDVKGATPNMIYRMSGAMPVEVLGNLEIRTSGPPSALVTTIRQALAELEPALPVFDIVPLDQRLHRGLTNDRLIANLTTVFGIVALLLACLGLYGTISYGVACRISELGVRMALGADRSSVAWLVVREALILVASGAALGLPLAFVAGRSVLSLLHGVDPIDPASYSQAAALLLLVGGVAAYLPAHRASRIDPMVALRSE
jgi:predicted permease